MAPARKVFTEAMIRKVLKAHYEVEPNEVLGPRPLPAYSCECGWDGMGFEDHFIDQLHKLWHETMSRPKSPRSDAEESLDAAEKRQLSMGLKR